MFQKLPNKYLEKIAIINDTGKSISYSDLNNIANKFKNQIKKRSLVFCLCKNTIGSLYGYFSFIKNGIVPLMLDASLDKELLSKLLETYSPEYIWVSKERVKEFPGKQIIYSLEDYSLLRLNKNNIYQLNKDLALLLTTSGSTGSPKLVRISYGNVEANAISIAEYLSIDENERPITALPMNYSFGLSIINSHLIRGATILLTSRSIMEKEFWSFLKEQRASSLSGVPYTFEILKKLHFFRMDLSSITTLTQAGGKLHDELNKELSEFCFHSKKRFFVMYGQTEATARMSYLPPEYSLAKLGSMGVAIPGGEFSLIDESGSTIEGPGIIGELVYKGGNVSMGYAECGDDLQKGNDNNGILLTGDLAKRDRDNFYYIVGRKKRFIKLYGNRVDLDETERILKNIISDCACLGEDGYMMIYITERTRIEEVRNYISSKTGIHHSVFTVRYIDTIPKNPSGKTIYSNLALL
ncbi:Long-chain-fatty-acid--CoA ligase [hydrothermal vent metagenome]|uniref:Long-chain-fatty-acid--CoA ligase n=1 Tax=hydrothermal vent metagenome TaxID=652676 RepID=A0A3B0U537_9ZZZZ